MANKARTPTCITFSLSSSSTRKALFMNLMKKFQWRSIFIVTEQESSPIWSEQAKIVRQWYDSVPDTQTDFITIWPSRGVDYFKLLQRFSLSSRVLLYVGYSLHLRNLLIQAATLNMTNGEYVYIALIPYRGSFSGNLTWEFNDSYDEIARYAFRSLLIIEPDHDVYGRSNGSRQYINKWEKISSAKYNYSYDPAEIVSTNLASTYAAMMAFGQVVDEVRSRLPHFNFTNGNELAKHFFNRSFSSNTGVVFVNAVGERLPVIVVTDMNVTTGIFEPALLQSPTNLFKLEEVQPVDWPGSQIPPNEPRCGYRNEAAICARPYFVLYPALGGGAAIVLIFTVWAALIFRKKIEEWSFQNPWWKIDPNELYVGNGRLLWPVTIAGTDGHDIAIQLEFLNSRSGIYRSSPIWVANVFSLPVQFTPKNSEGAAFPRTSLKHLNHMRDLSSDNINRFRGICVLWTSESNIVFFVSDLCAKGSLGVLMGSLHLDFDLQISFIMDLLNGMFDIKQSGLKIHGDLSISRCLIDHRFNLKISHVGYSRLQQLIFPSQNSTKARPDRDQKKLFYVAPEILRKEVEPNPSSDVYSIGVILNQILTSCEPYEEHNGSRPGFLENVIEAIKNGRLKPQVLRPRTTLDEKLAPLVQIIERCWQENPVLRGGINGVYRDFKKVLRNVLGMERVSLFEKAVSQLERNTRELDRQVAERTEELIIEMKKCDDLLREMLPSIIVAQLRSRTEMEPEIFDSTSILFSSVGGFITLLDTTGSAYIMRFLNDIYTTFDEICNVFDAYKVETIADSYMVSSGVPVRNGDNHIREISSLALTLMTAYQPFMMSTSTALRIGLHSGSCAAGVIGVKTLRYCLFGDAVNTTARMLSHGEDHKIHLSSTASDLLRNFPGFVTTERGLMEVKGKGQMLTYWLERKTGSSSS